MKDKLSDNLILLGPYAECRAGVGRMGLNGYQIHI
jgi:hypothetical protein